MNKPSLIEIVQSILGSMDGDEVNDIHDTIESGQVADVVRQVYYGIVEEYDLQSEESMFQLESSGNASRPTHMVIPKGIFDITLVRYNIKRADETTSRFKTMGYLGRAEFLDHIGVRDSSEPHLMEVVDPSGIPLIVHTNGPPTCYTSLDGGRSLVFDGFDTSVDSALQASKTQCLGMKKRQFVMESGAEVDLPETLHQLLINEARELCFELYKDGAPRKLNELTRRSRVRAKQRDNKVRTPPDTLPDYGRKRRGR
jgi:hypothetical protein